MKEQLGLGKVKGLVLCLIKFQYEKLMWEPRPLLTASIREITVVIEPSLFKKINQGNLGLSSQLNVPCFQL